MAPIAACRVVDVIPNASVVGVGIRFRVLVAGYARKHCEVSRVRVAIAAGRPLAGVSSGIDREPGMIERRAGPGGRSMACRTGGRE
jgi:hypothetical protein